MQSSNVNNNKNRICSNLYGHQLGRQHHQTATETKTRNNNNPNKIHLNDFLRIETANKKQNAREEKSDGGENVLL